LALDQQLLRELVRSAILAPSADNHHHSLFELVPEGLRLWAGPGYLECHEQHRKILTRISFGASLENLFLDGCRLGYIATLKNDPDPKNPAVLADIQFRPDPSVRSGDEAALAEMIPVRHTNRRFYKRTAAGAAELDQIQSQAGSQSGVDLRWLDAPELRSQALRLIRHAETERFRRRYLHEELFSAIRFDVGWNESCEEGLPPSTLEVEFGMRRAFELIGNWRWMGLLTKAGAHHVLALRAAYLPCKLAPHIGVVCTDGDPEAGAIRVGRAFQRIWLKATALGLSLQPLVASAILPFQSPREDGVSHEVRTTLAAGWRNVLGDKYPLVLFRMGYASPPTQVASRLPVERYLRVG
jgi:hypothetical protein